MGLKGALLFLAVIQGTDAAKPVKTNSGPLDTCDRQKQCATFEVFKTPSPILCGDKTCEFEVCLRLHKKEGANCPDSISHTCKKPVVMCRDDTKEMWDASGFPKSLSDSAFAIETQGPRLDEEDGYLDCQVVGPDQLVEFLIKDGSGCKASSDNVELFPESGIGGPARCAPRPSKTESCTGNGEGVECIWTYRTPNCDGTTQTTYEGGTATENIETTNQNHPPGANGDPHFRTWVGEMYDFHGICDLVLLRNPRFKNGQGMDINLRSKKTRQWSFVSAAVLRIGDDTLEVAGARDGDNYWVNGVEGNGISLSISGYPVTIRQINSKQKEFSVSLDLGEKIIIKTWKDFVRVDIKSQDPMYFAGSVGLMGNFPTGKKLARDGKTVMEDANSFGQEWQVRADEPMLFHNRDGVQAPTKCEVPSSSAVRRNLAESSITMGMAQIACAHVDGTERDLCIFDVMATNDVDSAGAY